MDIFSVLRPHLPMRVGLRFAMGSCASIASPLLLAACAALTAALAAPSFAADVVMPDRGICAHRGASETHPENTIAALREAIRLGAHMIEFDVAMTKDEQLVLMHDNTIDRTTDGKGPVASWTLEALKKLDAGSWKGADFNGEKIPTLDEALAVMPVNIWLNVHLKGDALLAERVTRRLVAHQRLHQAFLACGSQAAAAAKRVDKRIKICNMTGQSNSLPYVKATIAMKADFIQLYQGKSVDPAHTTLLRQNGVRINFCCANDAEIVRGLFEAGAEFPLVDRLGPMLAVSDKLGIERLKPIYRASQRIAQGPCIGHLTANTAFVWARCLAPGKYRLRARAANGHEVSATRTAHAENDGCVTWRVQGLQPGTQYQYSIEFAGQSLVGGDEYTFTTPQRDGASTVRLAFASCAKEDAATAEVWRQMRSSNPNAVVLLGDTPYIDSTNLAVQRRRYAEFASAPGFKELVRSRSLYSVWDDHDFGRNDTDGNLPGKENSRRAFMEFRANPSFGDGKAGIYTKFRRGDVEVFLLDTRFFAATEPSPFAKDRPTLLGAAQWKWLRRELQNSTATFKVLACGMVWNQAVRPGKLDHWGTYPHERRALFDFIGAERISGVVLIGGDIHRTRVLKHATAEQAGYDIWELITSPAHDSVIANAKVAHPALVHDSGEPHAFLLVTVEGSDGAPTFTATFLNKAGRQLFEKRLNAKDLK